MGVQMPGPMDASFEQGFNPTGEDMSNLAPRGGNSSGMDMPHGSIESEAGWLDGQDYSNLASMDPVPVANDFGVFSDDASFIGDVASSAQPVVLGENAFSYMFPGYSGTTAAPEGNQNSYTSLPSSTGTKPEGGPVSGMDAMEGLDG